MTIMWLVGTAFGLSAMAPRATVQDLDPDRVKWSSITVSARKLGFSTTSDIEFARVPRAKAESELLEPDLKGEYALPQGSEVAVMRVASSFLGRDSHTRFWLDPHDSTVYQRILVETGKRPRYKAYRFTEDGAWEYRKNPVEGEEEKSHEQWSNIRSEVGHYPGWPRNGPVTESAGLFYIVAAAPLDRAGDRLLAHVVSKEQVYPIEIRVVKIEPISVDYSRNEKGKKTRANGKVSAVLLYLEPKPPEGMDARDFKLIGLEGAVHLWLHPEGRYPLQIEGKVPYAGKVRIVLKKVEIGSS